MQVFISDLTTKLTINCENSDTVLSVKEKIQKVQGWHPDKIHLIYRGKILPNENILSDFNIKDCDILHLVSRERGD